MTNTFRAFLALCFGLFLAACQKDFSIDNGVIDPDLPPATNITATVSGRVTNELGAPVKGAMVTAGTSTAITDVNGMFKINNAGLVDRAAFVKVEKAGYFLGSRTFRATDASKNYVEIQLLPKTTIGAVNASAGGTLTLSNGSVITLPANGVVLKSNNAAYTGVVKVAMAWIDPTSASLQQIMPGDLRGVDASGAERGMISYGMMGVELEGTSGEKLQIAPGKKAQLKFPLPSAIQAGAPATIALWSFDETTGLWKQEGTATKVGTKYEAEVSHFSFWNCDAPFDIVAFQAIVKDQNGNVMPHVLVKIKRLPGTGWYNSGAAFTDSAGKVSGMVPKNEQLVLEVYGSSACNAVLHTQNIGPFNSTASVNVTVNVPSALTFTISGTAENCSAAPVTDGYIEVQAGFRTYRAPVVNGAFSLSFTGCSPTQQVDYFVADNASNQQSTPVTTTITSGNNAVGVVAACGISTQQFINFTVDGTNYNFTVPADSLTAYKNQQGGMTGGGTSVSGLASTGSFRFIGWTFDGSATGNFPLSYIDLSVPSLNDSVVVSTAMPVTVTITEYGQPGGYISGSFSGVLAGSLTPNHTIQCSFRVRRQF